MKTCINCDEILNEEDKFCANCGTVVEEKKKSRFKVVIIIGAIFIAFILIITLISSVVASSNLSWLYRGFKYPSMILAIASLIFGISFVGRNNEISNPAKLDTVIVRWLSKKGKRSGKLKDMVESRIDSKSISLGIYESSKKISDNDFPNYIKALKSFIEKEEITGIESLDKCLRKRESIRKSKYADKFDSEVKSFISGVHNSVVNDGILLKGILKGRNIVRGVGIFLLIFSAASLIRMEVEFKLVSIYAIEGLLLLFISRYIFGFADLGKGFKIEVKSLKLNVKNIKSFILDTGDFSEALALSVSLNKEKKFKKAVKKLSEDDLSELRISNEEINESYRKMNFYFKLGEMLYKNSIYGRDKKVELEGGEINGN